MKLIVTLAATAVLLLVQAVPTSPDSVQTLSVTSQDACIDLVNEAKGGCSDCDANEFRKKLEDVFAKKCDQALGDHRLCQRCEKCIETARAQAIDGWHHMDAFELCEVILSEAPIPEIKDVFAAMDPDGQDMSDALVKKMTNGEYDSCAHVASQGLCDMRVARTACKQACSVKADLKKIVREEDDVHAMKRCSDERLKTNITYHGSSDAGVPIASFFYKPGTSAAKRYGTTTRYRGTIVQKLLGTPFESAVVHLADGFMAVDYSKLDVSFEPM